ncbi:MAG: biopolymer transporter ExbD [Bacteriovoracaceae bacterium]|nr:biopolymer transporter ExbD [Bacteriovoracaceae bacterium]
MRLQRSIRHRGRRRNKGAMELDITSLLDILVIMLVFLLKSYNSSGIFINIPQGVTLPISASSSINTSGIIVQVSPSKIWVEDKVILDTKNLPPKVYDHGRRRIISLYNELVKRKEVIKQVQKSSPEAQKFTGRINFVIDKSLKYSYIKKLMYTCAAAGFQQYKFIVMGEDT